MPSYNVATECLLEMFVAAFDIFVARLLGAPMGLCKGPEGTGIT